MEPGDHDDAGDDPDEYERQRAERRLEIAEGLLAANDRWSEVSAAVESASDRGEARRRLTSAPFGFSEMVANHVLDIQISRRTRLGRRQLAEEADELRRSLGIDSPSSTGGAPMSGSAPPVASLTCVTFDCADPGPLARFWAAVLGWDGVHVADDGSGAICATSSGGPYLEFVRVPEPKRTKNRLHLGCSAASLDELGLLIDRLVSLGATVAWEEEFPPEVAAHHRNVVLRDPEGNELCLGGGSFAG